MAPLMRNKLLLSAVSRASSSSIIFFPFSNSVSSVFNRSSNRSLIPSSFLKLNSFFVLVFVLLVSGFALMSFFFLAGQRAYFFSELPDRLDHKSFESRCAQDFVPVDSFFDPVRKYFFDLLCNKTDLLSATPAMLLRIFPVEANTVQFEQFVESVFQGLHIALEANVRRYVISAGSDVAGNVDVSRDIKRRLWVTDINSKVAAYEGGLAVVEAAEPERAVVAPVVFHVGRGAEEIYFPLLGII